MMGRFGTAEIEGYVQDMHILISAGEENPPILKDGIYKILFPKFFQTNNSLLILYFLILKHIAIFNIHYH
jgi:hypothetical protein